MNKQPTVSIVIPCYNEAGSIPVLLSAYDAAITRDDIEVILVNTTSSDNSETILEELQPKYKRFLRVINTPQRGYGAGIITGLYAAQGTFIGWTHGDLQISPEDVLQALPIIESHNFDSNLFIKGKRKGRTYFDTFFTLGMSFFETLYLRQPLFDINAQPNFFHRNFISSWDSPPHDYSLDLYALYKAQKARLLIIRFPAQSMPRPYGHSSWNTGLSARWRFIKRTISFSFSLKERLK
jgi:polyisoprenyl-phosphate glycosyltransferase